MLSYSRVSKVPSLAARLETVTGFTLVPKTRGKGDFNGTYIVKFTLEDF